MLCTVNCHLNKHFLSELNFMRFINDLFFDTKCVECRSSYAGFAMDFFLTFLSCGSSGDGRK